MPSSLQPRIHFDRVLYSVFLERELDRLCPQLCTFTAPNGDHEEKVLRHVIEAGGEVFITPDESYYIAGRSSGLTVLILQGSIHGVPFSRLAIQDKARVLVQLLEQKKEEILGVTGVHKRSMPNSSCIAYLGTTKNSIWTIGEPSPAFEKRVLKRFSRSDLFSENQ